MISTAVLIIELVLQAPTVIDVVYPRISPGDSIPRIDRVDSNFVFGSVQPPDARLWIDELETVPRSNGAFLSFQPVDWTAKHYRLMAVSDGDTTHLTVPFSTKPPGTPLQPPAGDYPRLLELGAQPIRTDPKGTYFIFPAAGTRVAATSWAAGYFQIPLAFGRSAWIEARTVKDLGKGTPPAPVAIWKIELDTTGGLSIFVPIDRKLLVRLNDESNPDRISLEFFGAISHIDLISYPPGTGAIREIYWEQDSDGVVRLDVRLNKALWGYRGVWEEKGYRLWLRASTAKDSDLSDIRIAVDPGHGGSQDGAIGPMRLTEKAANLACAKALVERLQKAGAAVMLTLESDSTMGLPERIARAEAFDADLFISLHHNALPDGINPFEPKFGTGTHYYRPQSRRLAELVQREVVAEFGLIDEGVFYHDLAVVRPTTQPAILLEAAYMMLPEQEALILDEKYPDRLAKAIEKGIREYLRE